MKVENNQQPQPNMQQQMDQMLQQQGQEQPVQPMQPMNGPAKKKKKCNVPALVLGVVAVLGVGAGAYFGVQYFGEKDRADKLAKQNTTVATAEVAETPSEEGTTEVASNQVSYGFDSDKVDQAKGVSYMLFDNFEDLTIITKSNDQKTLVISTPSDTSNLAQIYGLSRISEIHKEIKMDKKISDLMIGAFGQATGDEMILMIMEDGTVGYLPVYSMLKDGNFTVKSLDGITNAVKFYMTNSDGIYTMVQTADGKIYNLWYALQNAGVVK